MHRGESAHRQADDMGRVDLEPIEHRANVVAGTRLRIPLDVLRYVGGRKAARVVGDAAIALAEVAKLGSHDRSRRRTRARTRPERRAPTS